MVYAKDAAEVDSVSDISPLAELAAMVIQDNAKLKHQQDERIQQSRRTTSSLWRGPDQHDGADDDSTGGAGGLGSGVGLDGPHFVM